MIYFVGWTNLGNKIFIDKFENFYYLSAYFKTTSHD